jgi:nucleoside-diphosphate-sugar epimerase
MKLALADEVFDVVLHLAAADQRQPPADMLKTNIGGTANLMQALQNHPPKKVIYISSFKVYGATSGIISEQTELLSEYNTQSYGYSKFGGEQTMMALGSSWGAQLINLRLSNAYGAPKRKDINAWHLLFNDLCQSAYYTAKITLNSPPDTLLDMIWMGDVCQVILQALEHPTLYGKFNLGFGNSITTGEVATAVAEAYQQHFNYPIEIIQPAPAGNFQPLVFDCTKLQQQIPYTPKHHFQEEAVKAFQLLAG